MSTKTNPIEAVPYKGYTNFYLVTGHGTYQDKPSSLNKQKCIVPPGIKIIFTSPASEFGWSDKDKPILEELKRPESDMPFLLTVDSTWARSWKKGQRRQFGHRVEYEEGDWYYDLLLSLDTADDIVQSGIFKFPIKNDLLSKPSIIKTKKYGLPIHSGDIMTVPEMKNWIRDHKNGTSMSDKSIPTKKEDLIEFIHDIYDEENITSKSVYKMKKWLVKYLPGTLKEKVEIPIKKKDIKDLILEVQKDPNCQKPKLEIGFYRTKGTVDFLNSVFFDGDGTCLFNPENTKSPGDDIDLITQMGHTDGTDNSDTTLWWSRHSRYNIQTDRCIREPSKRDKKTGKNTRIFVDNRGTSNFEGDSSISRIVSEIIHKGLIGTRENPTVLFITPCRVTGEITSGKRRDFRYHQSAQIVLEKDRKQRQIMIERAKIRIERGDLETEIDTIRRKEDMIFVENLEESSARRGIAGHLQKSSLEKWGKMGEEYDDPNAFFKDDIERGKLGLFRQASDLGFQHDMAKLKRSGSFIDSDEEILCEILDEENCNIYPSDCDWKEYEDSFGDIDGFCISKVANRLEADDLDCEGDIENDDCPTICADFDKNDEIRIRFNSGKNEEEWFKGKVTEIVGDGEIGDNIKVELNNGTHNWYTIMTDHLLLNDDESIHSCKWNHTDEEYEDSSEEDEGSGEEYEDSSEEDEGSDEEEDYDEEEEEKKKNYGEDEEDYDECNDLRKSDCSEPCEWEKGVGRGSKGVCVTSVYQEEDEEDYDECNDLRKSDCSEPCEWEKGLGRGSKGVCVTSIYQEEDEEDYDECNDSLKSNCKNPCYWEKGVGRGSKGICKERDQSKSRVNCLDFTTNSGKKCPECCSEHTDDCKWQRGSRGKKGKCIDL
jgi:hypothetical protein